MDPGTAAMYLASTTISASFITSPVIISFLAGFIVGMIVMVRSK